MSLKKALPLLIVSLLSSQPALAILPPWYSYQRTLQATVGASDCVRVSAPKPPAEGEKAYTIFVQACATPAAVGLKTALKAEAPYVVVKVLDRDGTEVPATDASSLDELKQRFRAALEGNRYFAAVSDRRAMRADFSVELRALVIRIPADNLADPYGTSNLSAQDAFAKVLNKDFAGPHSAAYTTAPQQ
ncbi:MAG: hypothetical protein HY075_05415 [Deltaproteobacteria bacterium]|nr:hypothetical protein [Deltaproteobacteria bacterium]